MIASTVDRQRIHVQGVVQGVGFRPHVYGLATRLGLTGFVGNDSGGVFIEVEGPPAAVSAFQEALESTPPPLARIESIHAESIPARGDPAFTIVDSTTAAHAHTLISPDLTVCDDCLRELFDPQDRRYRYPFINCTNCGPRFTITRGVPYDRPLTTMAPFAMCPACRAEYENPLDRRFHAQPNACPLCGPHVEFWTTQPGASVRPVAHGDQAMLAAQRALAAGQIVAVKGLGGFHLACDAANERAVRRLRQRKQRPHKPLAVMTADVAGAAAIAQVDAAAERLLRSRERPIVLLRKRTPASVAQEIAQEVAPGNPRIGVMLPYTPLHYLLLTPTAEVPDAPPVLVMTSANRANEPIVADNATALAELAGVADAFLLHDRVIHMRCDDSVVLVSRGQELPVRRSRGYAPLPVKLPVSVAPTLAVGGELKNTFCLAAGEHAFLSQHVGDMENLAIQGAFAEAAAHFQALYDIQPTRLVADAHPGYLSSRWAEAHAGPDQLVRVQHHHAHIAALMAEHGLDGAQPVIGLSFDGTGYGTDGAVWGGEVLVADYAGFRRAAHLAYVPLPGGDAAVQRPYRMALAHLWAAGIDWDERLAPVAHCAPAERRVLRRQLERNVNTVPTSSMGRLFDAVAALAGVRQVATYEAQAAIELEGLVRPDIAGQYDLPILPGEDPTARGVTGPERIDAGAVMRAIVADLLNGASPAEVATKFHRGVAALAVDVSERIRRRTGIETVALSGGVYQNVALLELTVDALVARGFMVLTHQSVPPNDGGLALGQVLVGHFAAQPGRREER
jgi:hydrogenase maturation protein HypF